MLANALFPYALSQTSHTGTRCPMRLLNLLEDVNKTITREVS